MQIRAVPQSELWHAVVVTGALTLLLALFAATVVWLVGIPGLPVSEVEHESRLVAGDPVSVALKPSVAGESRASVQLDLPPRGAGESRYILRVARDPAEQVWIEAPGWTSDRLDFYRPAASEGLLPTVYRFPLPDSLVGEVAIDVRTRGAVPATLQVHVLHEDAGARWQQRVLALNVIVYSACFILALIAVVLFGAVREPFFLLLFATCMLAGVLYAAVNGHVYGFPGLRWFGALRAQGIWALALLFAASVVALSLQLTAIQQERSPGRLARVLCCVLVLLGAVLMLGLETVAPFALHVAIIGCAIAAACILWLLGAAVRERVTMSIPALLLFVLFLAAALARTAVALGTLVDTLWIRYGYQLATMALLAVLAMALMGRISTYRQQRDDARDARAATERRMAREESRAALARTLQAKLRELAAADIEWTAFRLMFEHLLPHVPADIAAVVASGYHGRDIMVSEPLEEKSMADGLTGTRLLMLKRQAQAGRPLQHVLKVGASSRAEAVIPFQVSAQGWGALVLQRRAGATFDDEELSAASEFVRLTALHADEAVATLALRHTAERDALTGSHNRRSIDHWLARQFARKESGPISLLFVDIDHFKSVNDVHGHACGDHCLRTVAAALRSALGTQDLLGRYGGEEFIVLLPDAHLARARATAERLRLAVEALEIDWQGAKHRITVSIGVAARAAADQSPAAFMDRADSALYEAKRSGRNRVAVSRSSFDA